MLRFASLGSGSRGNALLLETPHVRILVDCGFPAREIETRLDSLGVDPQTLTAILVTHEHVDHVRGVGAMARRYGLPVWLTAGTLRGGGLGELPECRRIDCHQGWFSLGDLRVLPFPVPHDAREPCQFLFQLGRRRLGLLTDTGHVTQHIRDNLQSCEGLVLEFNHDQEMLANGPYPPRLKARVGGLQGHLSNSQAVGLLREIHQAGLRHLVASHLSETNNSEQQVRESVSRELPRLLDRLRFARQGGVTDWCDME